MQKPSRPVWIAALIVSVICIAGLAYALISDWNTQPNRTLPSQPTAGSGFALGVLVGAGAGFVIGWLVAVRKR